MIYMIPVVAALTGYPGGPSRGSPRMSGVS
jgi:hypothetical protein